MVRLAGDYKSRGNQAQILGSNSRISSSGLTQTKEETYKFEKKRSKKRKKNFSPINACQLLKMIRNIQEANTTCGKVESWKKISRSDKNKTKQNNTRKTENFEGNRKLCEKQKEN